MKNCTVIWTKEDVQKVEKEVDYTINPPLSDNEIQNILTFMQDTYDPSIGITWETVEIVIKKFIEKRGKLK